MKLKINPATSNVAEYVEDLRHTIVVAGLNYDIWWIYEEKDARAKYIEILNRYLSFFKTSIHAHFVAMIVALYRLYEKRPDTFNIPQFISLLEKDKVVPPATLNSLRKKMDSARPLWVKVSVLRNEVFAHRSLELSVLDVFKKAKVKPDEIKHLIELTKDLLNEATQAWNRDTHAFNQNASTDTIDLLDDLMKLKSSL